MANAVLHCIHLHSNSPLNKHIWQKTSASHAVFHAHLQHLGETAYLSQTLNDGMEESIEESEVQYTDSFTQKKCKRGTMENVQMGWIGDAWTFKTKALAFVHCTL